MMLSNRFCSKSYFWSDNFYQWGAGRGEGKSFPSVEISIQIIKNNFPVDEFLLTTNFLFHMLSATLTLRKTDVIAT